MPLVQTGLQSSDWVIMEVISAWVLVLVLDSVLVFGFSIGFGFGSGLFSFYSFTLLYYIKIVTFFTQLLEFSYGLGMYCDRPVLCY
jgi:hypothetical protein